MLRVYAEFWCFVQDALPQKQEGNTTWGPELQKLVNFQKILESNDDALKVALPSSLGI